MNDVLYNKTTLFLILKIWKYLNDERFESIYKKIPKNKVPNNKFRFWFNEYREILFKKLQRHLTEVDYPFELKVKLAELCQLKNCSLAEFVELVKIFYPEKLQEVKRWKSPTNDFFADCQNDLLEFS